MPETLIAPPELGTDRLVSHHLVHKAAPEQVFVTDWMAGPGHDLSTVAGRLPLAHARFSDTAAPYHELLLIAEAVRQAGIVVVSQLLGVEPERQFLLRELRLEVDSPEPLRKTRGSCDLLVTQDPSSTVKMRPGRSLVGGRMRSRIAIGGRPAGSCEILGAWVPSEIYASLRGTRREAPSATGLPPPTRQAEVETRTGKLNAANSVISPLRRADAGGHEATLVIDTDDPTFFDHPLDHLPGLYLLAGIQQVAIAAACEETGMAHSQVIVTGFELRFSRMAELQPEVTCSVELDADRGGGRVACSQAGERCCDGTVRIARV